MDWGQCVIPKKIRSLPLLIYFKRPKYPILYWAKMQDPSKGSFAKFYSFPLNKVHCRIDAYILNPHSYRERANKVKKSYKYMSTLHWGFFFVFLWKMNRYAMLKTFLPTIFPSVISDVKQSLLSVNHLEKLWLYIWILVNVLVKWSLNAPGWARICRRQFFAHYWDLDKRISLLFIH